MDVRWAIAIAMAFALALATRGARASQEAHQTGDDARLIVEGNGVASVEHELRWRVVRGPLRAIDLVGVSRGAVIDPQVSIAAADGRTWPGHAVRRDDGTVHVTVDDPRALVRGTFAFAVRARIDLVATGAAVRDGAGWTLAWSGPAVADGVDGARLTIDLPAAPEEPHAIAPDTGAIDDSVVSTLRRALDRDVLELVLPHVARGDSPTWTIRVDPRALPLAAAHPVHPAPVITPPPAADRIREVSRAALLLALAIAFGALTGCKTRAFASACAPFGVRPLGLFPLPDRVRPLFAGTALAAAFGLEVAGEVTAGVACVSLAAAAAAFRAPATRPAIRGPGRWLAKCPEDAFAPTTPPVHWLDIDSVIGRLTAAAAAAFVVGTAFILRRFDSDGAWLVALDAIALVPLFVTGRASQLPPHGTRSAAPWLARVFRSLSDVNGLGVTPWARVAPDGATADELRLLVLPCAPIPGVIGLEIGLAWSSTPAGWAATPEVLVRVVDGSDAARTLARELSRDRSVPGRRPDERVTRLLPRAPTRSSTVALVSALARLLALEQGVSRTSVRPAPLHSAHADSAIAVALRAQPKRA